jgi:hypothetical protein
VLNMEDRNQSVLAMYLAGERTHVIGKLHGITKQRAIQIAKAMGAKGRVYEPAKGETGFGLCKVDGCKTQVRSRWATLCNTHYFRGRRTGTTADRERRGPQLTSHGYLARQMKGHGAASKKGLLYEHRRVFFEHHGPEGHSCKWCGISLVWGAKGKHKLVIDHLNGDKTDNEINNLAASCFRCNSARGLFMSWVARHQDDPILAKMFAGKGAWDETDWRPK